MGIPRRGKFYQGPGLKHTSDIFHVLSTQSFSQSSPHTGGTPGAYKNKQTNDRVSKKNVKFFEKLELSIGQIDKIFWKRNVY